MIQTFDIHSLVDLYTFDKLKLQPRPSGEIRMNRRSFLAEYTCAIVVKSSRINRLY